MFIMTMKIDEMN